MPGKNEQDSLDMFLEVENMELDCELAFSACYSATSCWEGRWNDVQGSEKADFQRLFLQQGCGVVCCERRDGGMQWLGWDTLGARESSLVCTVLAQRRSKSSWLEPAKLLLVEKADTGYHEWCAVPENQKLSQGEKNLRVIGRKKRKTVRDSGVVNGAGHAGCCV